MLILILIDVQYWQEAVFSFEKGLNGQDHSSDSHYVVKKFHLQQNFWFPPPLTVISLLKPKYY